MAPLFSQTSPIQVRGYDDIIREATLHAPCLILSVPVIRWSSLPKPFHPNVWLTDVWIPKYCQVKHWRLLWKRRLLIFKPKCCHLQSGITNALITLLIRKRLKAVQSYVSQNYTCFHNWQALIRHFEEWSDCLVIRGPPMAKSRRVKWYFNSKQTLNYRLAH